MMEMAFSQSKWIGVLTMWIAMIFVGPVEQGGGQVLEPVFQTAEHAAGSAQPSIITPIAKKNEAQNVKLGLVASGSMKTGGSSSKRLAAAEPEAGPPAGPDIKSMEESAIFANLDKLLDRFDSVEVVATGYSAGKESTGKTPSHPEYGITYSGVKVRKDTFSTIAADPKVFPLGTVLYIPGYGYGVVADTGSKIKGNKIDLYFKTKDQVYQQWGKKTVRVYVLIQGEGKVTEAMMDRLNSLKTVAVEQPASVSTK
ncbi:3D domain-containing protein [Paenibacillus sp. MBLB4367]|uniref:3D domain-containing protein n=1 Tax=Paenibacillus sp. MBLB4367 TaxID=3384767 RepID=UPI0039080106